MRRILVDAEKCAGCRFCEMVCSFQHEERFSPSFSRMTVVKEDRYGMDYPVFCRQCDPCPAVASCPTGALKKNESNIVTLDEDGCNGCGDCVDACTFNVIKMDEVLKPLICDLCGGTPVCVERCPTGALSYVEHEFVSDRPEDVFRELRARWGIYE